MRIVINTNVVVSGLLNPHGPSAAILRLIIAKKVEIALDSRLISEYSNVLKRPKFPFLSSEVDEFLEAFKSRAIVVSSIPLKITLPDPDDNPFLEIAIASKADYLVTGNIKHYPKKLCRNIRVVSPIEFVEIYRRR